MCGRYTLYQVDGLSSRFGFDEDEFEAVGADVRPRYNVAPEQVMPVITERDNGRHLELMRWGFMPVWARDGGDVFKYKTFNARSEGIFNKNTWRRAIRTTRCLVPSNGFYEWRSTPGGKQPYFIRPKGEELFSFAGVYRIKKDEGGEGWGTYAIITTDANHEMSFVHNRMPVILPKEDESRWLDPANETPEGLEGMLAPWPDSALTLYPVSRDVNTSRIDEGTLVLPINSK